MYYVCFVSIRPNPTKILLKKVPIYEFTKLLILVNLTNDTWC